MPPMTYEEIDSPITRTYLAVPDSVGIARHLTGTALHTWGLGHLVEDTTLVLSELFTNAVKAKPYAEVRLRLLRLPGVVAVEVWDSSPEPPVRRSADDELQSPGDDDPGGRGLGIVEFLAHGCGWRPEDGGKVVWALMPVTPP
jgi:anti-sigma regulatory factor (Ser/Thr protein kinase)